MANFEDGSYSCTPGIDLIAKVLAGRCQMRYTRAAVGKGKIQDGQNPKTMQEPADYVMDGKISAVANPINGECQVTIQINSSDVKHGFYATGILLFAEDPDEGEVPYTYLVLENGPEWIRPSTSAVGKLATFDIIAAVGDVDRVTATIDPDSIVTRAVVERLIAGATLNRDIEIPTQGWIAEGNQVYVDMPQADITEKMIPIITILPEYTNIAKKCGISTTARTLDGTLRIYAVRAPSRAITATLTLLCASTGYAGDGGSTGTDQYGKYELPVATQTRLGSVKIGDGVDVQADGTISLNRENIVDTVSATEDESDEIISKYFKNNN